MKMIPPVAPQDISSPAERRVFALLRRATVDAVAYHSLALSQHDYKRAGEIDFLIVSKSGVYVLEVKGGGVACRDGIWAYTDRFGVEHHSSEGPFQQASSAMFALEKRLRSELGDQAVERILFGFAVVTPDCLLDVASVEWSPETVIDADTLEGKGDLAAALEQLARYWAGRTTWRPPRLSDLLAEDVRHVLRPDFERVPSLRIRAGQLDTAFEELTEEQYQAIDLLDTAPRVLFEGGAGTGKSFLAAEAARRSAQAGHRTLFVCSQPIFAGFMRSRLADVPGLTVFHPMQGAVDRADVLIVDEAQDFMNADGLAVLDDLVIGGLTEGRWKMFLDPNRQRDLVGRFDEDALDLLRSEHPVPARLTRNCRNTRQIVRQTRLYTGADLGNPMAGEGPAVDFHDLDSEPEPRVIETVLRALRAEDVAMGSISVLSPVPFDRSAAATTADARKGRLVPLDEQLAGEWPLTVSSFATIAEFKGLENQFVVLIDTDQLAPGERGISELYVAMTRARAGLHLIASEAVRQRLGELALENMGSIEGLLDGF